MSFSAGQQSMKLRIISRARFSVTLLRSLKFSSRQWM
jgi:hypothetical protein